MENNIEKVLLCIFQIGEDEGYTCYYLKFKKEELIFSGGLKIFNVGFYGDREYFEMILYENNKIAAFQGTHSLFSTIKYEDNSLKFDSFKEERLYLYDDISRDFYIRSPTLIYDKNYGFIVYSSLYF